MAFGRGISGSYTLPFMLGGFSAIGGVGIVTAHDDAKGYSEGWEWDIYLTGGLGGFLGAEVKATRDYSFSKNAQKVRDIAGPFKNYGGSGSAYGIVAGYDYGVGATGITQHTLRLGGGEGGEGHLSTTGTWLLYRDIILPILSRFDSSSGGTSSKSTSKRGSSTILDPFGLGNLIQKWLEKNPDKKDELAKGGGSGGSGGGSSGSPGRETPCKLNCEAIKKIRG